MKIIDIKIKLTAVKTLVGEIGFGKLMKSLPALSKGTRKGGPFAALGKPETKKDADSRALIAEAVILYRILLTYYPQPEAERIIRKVIIDAAIKQLSLLIPRLRAEELNALSAEERTACYCGIIDKFPNTDWELRRDTPEEVAIDVTRCRLVELFDSVGQSELRDCCCHGDALYFKEFQPEIDFCRTTTIGSGCSCCDFAFRPIISSTEPPDTAKPEE